MKRFLLSLLAAMLFGLPMCADEITVDGTKRNYILYVPSNLGEDRPLLISCHGMNQDAAYQRNMLQIESVADTAKFVTVFPNGIDKSWDISGDRDLRFMQALIDEMVKKYAIDPDRVYLSGFSMGGMFTYHAMNRMADKIAAFAPISGYPMWGGNYSSSRPVPIIHTHGTTDDVVGFSGVAAVLSGWVDRNKCSKTAKVEKPYRAGHITKHTWSGGEEGVEVVLLEMANKGHWISNDGGVKTGDEIWKFCRRYSLNFTDPKVKITAPVGGLVYTTFGGKSEIPDITVSATATDPDNEIAKVSFYDGDSLVVEITEEPYEFVFCNLQKGKHEINVVATDIDGNTGSDVVVLNVKEPAGLSIISSFSKENSVPDGWLVSNGSTKRVGPKYDLTSGCRTLKFTGSKRDFASGLYVYSSSGRAAFARYAGKGTNSTLIFYPGKYQMNLRIANWNNPDLSPVTIAVETIGGEEVFTETITPAVNIGNNTANSFSGASVLKIPFDIYEKGQYVVSFYTEEKENADLVLGYFALILKEALTAVDNVEEAAQVVNVKYYNLSGVEIQKPENGIYIMRSVLSNGKQIGKIIMK